MPEPWFLQRLPPERRTPTSSPKPPFEPSPDPWTWREIPARAATIAAAYLTWIVGKLRRG